MSHGTYTCVNCGKSLGGYKDYSSDYEVFCTDCRMMVKIKNTLAVRDKKADALLDKYISTMLLPPGGEYTEQQIKDIKKCADEYFQYLKNKMLGGSHAI